MSAFVLEFLNGLFDVIFNDEIVCEFGKYPKMPFSKMFSKSSAASFACFMFLNFVRGYARIFAVSKSNIFIGNKALSFYPFTVKTFT